MVEHGLYQQAFNQNPDNLFITDAEGNIVATSTAFHEKFGQPKHLADTVSFLACPVRKVNGGIVPDPSRYSRTKHGDEVIILQAVGTDGASFPAELTLTPLMSGEFAGKIVDASDQLEMIEKAHLDELTGLYNRRGLLHFSRPMIEDAQEINKTLGLLYFDVDGFKDLNDSFGHATGDKLLEIIARRILGQFRQDDTLPSRSSDIFARLGGDEFVILLRNADQESLEAIAERLRAQIAEHSIIVDPKKINVTLSIGAVHGRHYDLENLIQQADTAMYEAKGAGKNRFVVRAAELNELKL